MTLSDTRILPRGFVVATLVGLIGAALAIVAGLPAAALVGSTLAVTALALLSEKRPRLRPVVPPAWRDLAFAVIGLTLGAGVTPNILSDLVRFPLSLALMVATLVTATFVAVMVLRIMLAADRSTAVLATSPGALSYALSLAIESRADLRLVTVLQGIRLAAITVFVPPLVTWMGGAIGQAEAPVSAGPWDSLVLLCVAALAGIAMTRLRVPAAWLLGGLIVSGVAHALGWVEGRPWEPMLLGGFVIAGAVIGARFGGFTRGELRRLAMAGMVVSTIAIVISALGSAVAARLIGLPFGQIWVAYAPGGVEGMAAIAASLGYDPVFVATHHIFRLMVLFAVLPLVIRKGPG